MIIQYFYQPFPTLELGDIILRELSQEDAQHYFNYMSKPVMADFLTADNLPTTLDAALSDLNYWSSLFHNKRSFYWGIALKDTNQLIGTIGFNIISIANNKAEISYDLDHDYWGRGIMLKAMKAVLKFADYALALTRVQATVIIDNKRSINLLERCGFACEGHLKKYEVVNGVHKDYYMYARVNYIAKSL
jgi:[ribosomal protein S5]-alanine N-acetyltransferase